MGEVSVKELRNHTRDVVRRIEAGDTLTLTVNGRPVADLVPHASRREAIAMHELVARFAGAPIRHVRPRDLAGTTTDDPLSGVD